MESSTTGRIFFFRVLFLRGRHEFSMVEEKEGRVKISDTEECRLCNMGRRETLKHVLSVCPQYQQRHAQKVREKEFPEVLNIRNIEEAKNMFYFVQAVKK